jgi:acyl transferase domain-containing protein/glutamate-1-semialdehyde aminotransferase/acyl-CoA synthetase (AMP-forming)/AMP-acid ligase II
MNNKMISHLKNLAQLKHDEAALTFLKDNSEPINISYDEFLQAVLRLGSRLLHVSEKQDRVILLYPSGIDYTVAFIACLYAGVIAVPVSVPKRRSENWKKLKYICDDCQAAFILTSQDIFETFSSWGSNIIDENRIKIITSDHKDGYGCDPLTERDVWDQDLAFLQYTSGSTANPKGVMVSYGNLWFHFEQMKSAWKTSSDTICVNWMPLTHDFGLIGMFLHCLFLGARFIFLSPESFIQQPVRWLKAISDYKATFSAGQNFAYDLCVQRLKNYSGAPLDLSSWVMAPNGGEVNRISTLRNFTRVCREFGFPSSALAPSYGLAEATLLVSVANENDVRSWLLEDGLSSGNPRPDDIINKASIGIPTVRQRVVIVDPDSRAIANNGDIGEIWVNGDNVAQGYFNKPELTKETFQAYTHSGEGPFLRTGDLGKYLNKSLYVMGRCKELIIINGVNHYPTDIEDLLQSTSNYFKYSCGAAFSVDFGGREELVVVQELTREGTRLESLDDLVLTAINKINEECGVAIYDLVLVRTGLIPKTSSGKVKRTLIARNYTEGELEFISSLKTMNSSTPVSSAPIAEEKDEAVLTKRGMVSLIQNYIAELRAINPSEIDINLPFSVYGLGSVEAVTLTGLIEDQGGRPVNPTAFFDFPTVTKLVEHLFEGAVSQGSEMNGTAGDDIAVIGMGCRFPGGIASPDDFWNVLINGKSVISDVPGSRWDHAKYYDPACSAADRMHTKRMGFVDNVEMFDAEFFGVSPREAVSMDPQQRMLLETTWHALEDAGIDPHSLDGSNAAVFIGASNNDYSSIIKRSDIRYASHAPTGNLLSLLANRISYSLNLHGPSLTIDTACSSSLVALHYACKSLSDNETNIAIVGGVNLILEPDLSIQFSQANLLSVGGACKTFCDDADGYVRSEGCGVVILKTYQQALKDGDPIQAIIKGSAINQDGQSHSITAPNGVSQERVIKKALKNAGVTAGDISYVEAHGTGTVLGDPIEVNALKNCLVVKERSQPLWIGSVKSNLGHLEAAAGMAGFMKVVLSMMHGVIPGQHYISTLNRHIDWDKETIRVVNRNLPFAEIGSEIHMGVSSFGIGGTNAHVVLKQAGNAASGAHAKQLPHEMLHLSAKSEQALNELARKYYNYLTRHPHASLNDICHTTRIGRSKFVFNLGFPATDVENLAGQLEDYINYGHASADHYKIIDKRHSVPDVVFLFPGQGAQYHGMGKELYLTSQVFNDEFSQCESIVNNYLDTTLADICWGEDISLITNVKYSQLAVFCIEYCLAKMWLDIGIKPKYLMGHSLGEFAAACIGGVISLDDGIRLLIQRGRLMATLKDKGQMLAVFSDVETVMEYISQEKLPVSISAINSRHQLMLSGSATVLQQMVLVFEANNIASTLLKNSIAFHSFLMSAIAADFRSEVEKITFKLSDFPIISSQLGRIASDEFTTVDYWVKHLLEPVNFYQAIKSLDQESLIGLEVGPGRVLTNLCLNENLGGLMDICPSIDPYQAEWKTIASSIFSLNAFKIKVDLYSHLSIPKHKVHALPCYPFQKNAFWPDIKKTGEPHGLKSINTHVQPTVSDEPAPATSGQHTDALKHIEIEIAQLVMEQLNIPVASPIDIRKNILDLGADSIILMGILKSINKKYNINIPIEFVFKGMSSIQLIAEYLIGQAGQITPATTPRQQSENQPVARQTLTEIRSNELQTVDLAYSINQTSLVQEYNKKTFQSKSIAQKYRHVLADSRAASGLRHSNKETVYPIVGNDAKGARFRDVDGNEYIDITMGFGVLLFGHNPDFIKNALLDQIEKGIQIGPQARHAGEVASLISEMTGVERVAFCNTGTEAVMVAVRLARKYKNKSKIVVFKGAYHGHFDDVLTSGFGGENLHSESIEYIYGDMTSIDLIESDIHNIAAVLVEPVQGRNLGLQPQQFLEILRELTSKYNVPLIFDEVLTGFRIHPGGAQHSFGVAADIVLYGKIVGGGLPIGVIAGKSQYLDLIDGGYWSFGDSSLPLSHRVFFAGTFNKNALTMACSLAVLGELKRIGMQAYTQLNNKTESFCKDLNSFFDANGMDLHVDHFGSLFRFTVHSHADLFFVGLLAKGIYIWEGKTCNFSLAHTEEDIRCVSDVIKQVATEIASNFSINADVTGNQNTNEDSFENDSCVLIEGEL